MTAKCCYCNFSCQGYKCTVTSIHIEEHGTAMHFDGHHLPGKSDKNVDALEIVNQSVKYFPRSVGAVFSNLTHISIVNCGLVKVMNFDFAGLEKLRFLNLRGNKLISLPDNLFRGMKHLYWINFSDNQLQTLSSRFLRPVLGSIRLVYLKNNPCIDAVFDQPDNDFEIIDALGASMAESADLVAYKFSESKMQTTPKHIPIAPTAPELLESTSGCGICWDSAIEVTFIPCGHCCCQACAESIRECHLCRRKIEKKQRIFCN